MFRICATVLALGGLLLSTPAALADVAPPPKCDATNDGQPCTTFQ